LISDLSNPKQLVQLKQTVVSVHTGQMVSSWAFLDQNKQQLRSDSDTKPKSVSARPDCQISLEK